MPHIESRESTEPAEAAHARGPAMTRRQQMLLDFLRECDWDATDSPTCPVCGYSLKALTRPICPECGLELMLTVGAARLQLKWLLIALAPGFFSGIAALFLLVPIVLRVIMGDGRMSLTMNAVDLFGWCSGLFAIYLAMNRTHFLAQTRTRQRWIALGIWTIHIIAFALLLLVGPKYI